MATNARIKINISFEECHECTDKRLIFLKNGHECTDKDKYFVGKMPRIHNKRAIFLWKNATNTRIKE
jgi:hypothetical protein